MGKKKDLSDKEDASWRTEIDEEREGADKFLAEKEMNINMQPVGNTFAPSVIQPPWSSDKVKWTEGRITRRLIVDISSKRSAKNMTTKWRHDQEQLSVLLSNYLYHLEKLCMFDGNAPDGASKTFFFMVKNNLWIESVNDLQTIEDVQALPEKMRKYLPGNYSCHYLPIRFTENDIEKIG